ncbi:MAG: hypothetical protein M3O30_19160 [Planctomycetota bacterium]|nr:hypothetical protein [Planctomycetota bacterium]
MGELFNKIPSKQSVWLARGIAVAADALQIGLFPIFAPGFAMPWNDALDLAVCAVLIFLLGWHIAFLPTFIIKDLPFVDLAPTWTIAVLIATRGQGKGSPIDSKVLPSAPNSQDENLLM